MFLLGRSQYVRGGDFHDLAKRCSTEPGSAREEQAGEGCEAGCHGRWSTSAQKMLSKPMGSHFGVFGAPPICRAYSSGVWDGYRICLDFDPWPNESPIRSGPKPTWWTLGTRFSQPASSTCDAAYLRLPPNSNMSNMLRSPWLHLLLATFHLLKNIYTYFLLVFNESITTGKMCFSFGGLMQTEATFVN